METLSAAQTEVPGRLRMDSWPALPDDENTEKNNQNPTTNQPPADDDWNFIDDPDDDQDLAEEKMNEAAQGGGNKGVQFNPKILYRCASTPDFGNYDGEPSSSHQAVDADSEDASANADPSQDTSATEESENDSTAQQPPASNPAATSAASAAAARALHARVPCCTVAMPVWPFSSRSRASVGSRRLPPPLLPP